MNVSLTPELEKFVTNKVASGRYHSASEVIRDGLRLLEKRDERPGFLVSSMEALERKLLEGIESLDRGEYGAMTAREIKAKIQRKKPELRNG
jgi:antitoxin ParD1/3/4